MSRTDRGLVEYFDVGVYIWIFVHLCNPINVWRIELLIGCLYSEGSENRFMVVLKSVRLYEGFPGSK